MIMADDRRPAGSRRPMRRDQHRRVQLEMARGIGRDIGGGQEGLYRSGLPQQQSAYLLRLARHAQGHDLFQQPP